jgi:gentisate 1,2-dioxygenase
MVAKVDPNNEFDEAYGKAMVDQNVAPLWPVLANLVPHHRPQPVTQTNLWKFRQIRPLLIKAGEVTPIEKAERRVLVLSDPGRGPAAMQTTATIYCGLQLLLPGEKAPSHKHTPSAARIVVEGEGAYTVVDGQKCPMKRGDLILTPSGSWHDHGHEGKVPVIWLDVLDLPIFVGFEGSYSVPGESVGQPTNFPPPSPDYTHAGLRPVMIETGTSYPILRFTWERTRQALEALKPQRKPGASVELAYVNPLTGARCLTTLGFTAMLLPAGETIKPRVRSASAVFHAVEGEGVSSVNGKEFAWEAGDTFSMAPFSSVEHLATSTGFLIRVDDEPLQRAIGYYEER